jgi:acyl carrier protein
MSGSIEQSVREFIVSNFLFGASFDFSDKDSLLEKGIIDSTGVLELVDYVQQTYNIKVEDDELTPDNLDSVEKLATYIAKKSDAAEQKAMVN